MQMMKLDLEWPDFYLFIWGERERVAWMKKIWGERDLDVDEIDVKHKTNNSTIWLTTRRLPPPIERKFNLWYDREQIDSCLVDGPLKISEFDRDATSRNESGQSHLLLGGLSIILLLLPPPAEK